MRDPRSQFLGNDKIYIKFKIKAVKIMKLNVFDLFDHHQSIKMKKKTMKRKIFNAVLPQLDYEVEFFITRKFNSFYLNFYFYRRNLYRYMIPIS